VKKRVLEGAETFLRSMRLDREKIPSFEAYPFAIPAIRTLDDFAFHAKVTLLRRRERHGESTLIEAIAVALGFNAEGGSRNFNFATFRSESPLHRYVRLVRGYRRPRTGYFLRAESFHNVASEIERLDAEGGGPSIIEAYGGVSLHAQSHGESFRALLEHQFRPGGLYVLDEPESALSPRRQFELLRRIHQLVRVGSAQFIVATHSPIVLAYPDAEIRELDANGMRRVAYDQTDTVRFTTTFLRDRESMLDEMLSEKG
jgi:predicted ATPase